MEAKTSKEMITINPIEFSAWLNDFVSAMEGKISNNVPCGECVACCTSSKFVHIRPSDSQALKHIPEEIMFPAPGLPAGYYLLGYDENGHCPMFVDGKCSIYEFRPETCRQYDCRVFAATGVSVEEESTEIARQSRKWQFNIISSEDKIKYQAVQRAAKFLLHYRDSFPDGYLPRIKSQLAVLAVRFHNEFDEPSTDYIEKRIKDLVNTIVEKY